MDTPRELHGRIAATRFAVLKIVEPTARLQADDARHVRIGGDAQDRRPPIVGHGDGTGERQRLDRRPGHGHARLIGDPHHDLPARLQHDLDGLLRLGLGELEIIVVDPLPSAVWRGGQEERATQEWS